jgi:hypothetical protein
MAKSPEGVRDVIRALEPYHPWLKTLAVINLIGWAVFELWVSFVASPAPDVVWRARTSVWVALLLFDVVAVVWWYGDVASRQHRLAEAMHSDIHRPFVVIDRARGPEPEPMTGPTYVVRNVGPGLSVNVFYVVDEDAGLAIHTLGALEGHGERGLPDALGRSLRNARGAVLQFAVVSERLAGHNGRWTVTANMLMPNGEVVHRAVPLDTEKRGESLRAHLEFQWPTVKTQFSALDQLR